MFSNLGPLFKTVFRETEHADARLEIRREEKENGRKNQGQDEEIQEDNSLWEDTTGVSVIALRTFLVEFLKEKGVTTTAEKAADNPSDIKALIDAPAVTPASTAAARAAKAYGSMAAQNHYTPPPVYTPNPDSDLASLLQSDEIRTIHRLIGELDQLSRGGLEMLTFQLNGTFLESVDMAVRAHKSQMGL